MQNLHRKKKLTTINKTNDRKRSKIQKEKGTDKTQSTLATSSGLTRMAERKAAPAAERARSVKPMSKSDRELDWRWLDTSLPSKNTASGIETFAAEAPPSKSTLDAALNHEGTVGLEHTIPSILLLQQEK